MILEEEADFLVGPPRDRSGSLRGKKEAVGCDRARRKNEIPGPDPDFPTARRGAPEQASILPLELASIRTEVHEHPDRWCALDLLLVERREIRLLQPVREEALY